MARRSAPVRGALGTVGRMPGTLGPLPNRENSTMLCARSDRPPFQSPDDYTMTNRQETERLLRDLYTARVKGDLAGVYDKFSPDARFQIAGASHSTPVAVRAVGANEY